MDLKIYYQKIREMSAQIANDFVVLVSVETPDGGRAGRFTEVRRDLAAKMLVEGRARLATSDEATEFRTEQGKALEAAEVEESRNRLQVTVIPEDDWNAIRKAVKSDQAADKRKV